MLYMTINENKQMITQIQITLILSYERNLLLLDIYELRLLTTFHLHRTCLLI